MKNFLAENIDRAITMAQHELEKLANSLWQRDKLRENPQTLYAITVNLVACAAGLDQEGAPSCTDEQYVDCFTSTFEDYLAMCKRLFNDCNSSEQEAIRLIVLWIVRLSEAMKAEVAAGKRKPSHDLRPLNKNSAWGRIILALSEAFAVKLE